MRMDLLPRQQQQRQRQQPTNNCQHQRQQTTATTTPTSNNNANNQHQQTTTTPTNNNNANKQQQQTTTTPTNNNNDNTNARTRQGFFSIPSPRSTGHSFVQAIDSAAVGAKLERKGRPTPRSGVGLSVQASLLQQPRARLFVPSFFAKGRENLEKKIGVSGPLHKGQKLSFHKVVQ